MKIKITADSTCDLSKEIIEKYGFGIIPVGVVFEDKVYKDGVDITSQAMFEMVDKTKKLPSTCAVNPSEFIDFFKRELEGYDAIIHFDISSKISSMYQNAFVGASEFEGKVFTIDSTSLSTGIALQMIYAKELADQGKTPQEICDLVVERQDKVQASFVIETLSYLYKGGRCSRLAMFGANLLKIRPVIALKDGKMDVETKLRGRYGDVVDNYIDYTLKKFNTPDKRRCFITFSSLSDELVEKIKEKIEPIFDEILVTHAGSTVSSHCGPNTVGILYYNDGE